MSEMEKLALLEEILEMDEGTLTPETILEDLDEYTSMAKLSVIVMMDDEFGVKVTGEMIKGFKSVSDILVLMQ